MNRLEKDTYLITEGRQRLKSSSLQTFTNDDRIINKPLGNFALMYLWFAIRIEIEILKRCSRKLFELQPLILGLKRSWRRRGKEVEEMRIPRQDGTMFRLSIPFWNAYCIRSPRLKLAVRINGSEKWCSMKGVDKSRVLFSRQPSTRCRWWKLYRIIECWNR